jgi:AAA15 family ATPase/GTPase
MIKEIKIENFKSISSLNVELGRLNVFIGANGSGKSNILEGIAFGAAAINDKLENVFLNARGIRITEPNLMISAFKDNKKRSTFSFQDINNNTLQISAEFRDNKWLAISFVDEEKSSILMEPEFAKKIWFSTDGNLHIGTEKFKVSEKLPEEILKQLHQMNNFQVNRRTEFLLETRLSDFMIFAPENSALRHFEEGLVSPLSVEGKGLFKLVQKIFKTQPEQFAKINEYLQLLDWFEGFEIPNDLMFTEQRIKIKDQFLLESIQYFDQRSTNEGFLYLLFYFTLFISDDTPKFFAIDNIDNAMNPKLGRELIKTLAHLSKKEEHDKQVILTTHNPAILDGLNLNDDEQRLFVVYRNAYGHTKVTRIFKTETPEGQRPLPLSEQFLRGYLGGLPDNF